MTDIHIRSILMIVIGVLSIGIAVGIKLVGATGIAPGLLVLVGIAAFLASGYLLLFVDEDQS